MGRKLNSLFWKMDSRLPEDEEAPEAQERIVRARETGFGFLASATT
jgi:hypothetical protein